MILASMFIVVCVLVSIVGGFNNSKYWAEALFVAKSIAVLYMIVVAVLVVFFHVC